MAAEAGRTSPPAHIPVLLSETLTLLEPAILAVSRPVVVDATVGLGGHSQAILERYPTAEVVGLDRDPQALALAAQKLAGYADRCHLVPTTYDRLPEIVRDLGHRRVDAILFDLGVSSLQLDEPDRGFSYARPAPLDMRMDPRLPVTAADILNTHSEDALARVLFDYGDERHARRIARVIVAARQDAPLARTDQLVDLIRAAIPAAARRTGGNPAKRTFQALRIAVNDELGVLRRAMPAAFGALRPGGRMVVLSYHSGEDRIVKAAFAAVAEVNLPPGLPIIDKHLIPAARVLTRGAAKASEDETQRNPRAASVRMRGVERLA